METPFNKTMPFLNDIEISIKFNGDRTFVVLENKGLSISMKEELLINSSQKIAETAAYLMAAYCLLPHQKNDGICQIVKEDEKFEYKKC